MKMYRKEFTLKILSFLKFVLYILTFLAICPRETLQQQTISKIADVQGLCIYRFDQNNRYHCDLFNVNITSRFDTLEIIGDHLPGHSNANVQSVEFRNGEIRFLNSELMETFPNLEYLDITNRRLQEINENTFQKCEKLQELRMLVNPLTTFPNGALRNCVNLRIFSATSLKLNAIPGDLFGAASSLEEFYITFNELTSLPDGLLSNMTRLRNVFIDGNFLTNLSNNFLPTVANLQKFSIWSNNFTDPLLIMSILDRHTDLKEIYLSMNPFTTFNFSFFEKFLQLEILWIGTTSGPRLTNILWSSLPRLLLTLVVNGIGEEIPENSFNQLTNLRNLELSGPGIVNFQRDTFRSLSQLQRLSIQNTNVKVLNPLLFIGLANLSDLDLSHNQIEELPFEIFGPLRNLGSQSINHGIRMSSNQLQSLNSTSFGRHPFTSSMNFSRNRINAIERGFFNRFNAAIFEADFTSNLCINISVKNSTNLDFFGDFERCYQNFEAGDITTPPPTTTPISTAPTTPDGCGSNFKKFEIFVIILIGFIKVVMNIAQ